MRSPTHVSIASTPSITSAPNPDASPLEPDRASSAPDGDSTTTNRRDLAGDDAHPQVERLSEVVVEVEQVAVRGRGGRVARVRRGCPDSKV